MERTLEIVKNEMEASIAEMKKAQINGDLKALNDAESALKKQEKEYASLAVHNEYDALKETEQPFDAAVRKRTYNTLKHVAKTAEDGTIIGYELVERQRQFDLLDLCRSLGIDTAWDYVLQCLNMHLTLRAGKELGYTKAEIAKIEVSYAMQKKAREIAEKGGDVTSNTQIKRALQELIDAMPTPVADDGGKVYKVNSYDVEYLKNCYCKKGKNTLAVATAKKGFLLGLVADILYRIATDGKYTVEYKAIKSK